MLQINGDAEPQRFTLGGRANRAGELKVHFPLGRRRWCFFALGFSPPPPPLLLTLWTVWASGFLVFGKGENDNIS